MADYEDDWGTLYGEPILLKEARELSLEERSHVVVRLPDGSLVRPYRIVLTPGEALAEISATVDEADEG